MSDELTPITRKETFLAKAGGQNVVTPTPITREETFLQAIIDNGSGGGGGTGGGVLVVGLISQTMALDKTWKEIYDASFTVIREIAPDGYNCLYVSGVYEASETDPYGVAAFTYDGESITSYYFITDSENGYPVYRE